MRKMKKVFAALLLLFVTNTLMAQSETYTLKGCLKDANDGAIRVLATNSSNNAANTFLPFLMASLFGT